tara:strand:+ start:4076 stop:4810 length:735 start_codon:yes stop_codon:yes gene_type:complete
MSESLTAVIPARGGSKGVARKNIKLLHDHPLISYSIMACKMSTMIDEVVVSTDDDEIAKIAESYGAEILERPDEYAQDNSTDWQVIDHFFQSYSVDDVVYLRPTTPLRNPDNMDDCIEFYLENRNRMSGLRSMHELPECPYKVFKLTEDGYCEGFFEDFNGIKDYTNLPRQNFPKAYQPNGYIDIAKRETVESGESAFATTILPYISEVVTEVDTEYEFDLLTHQLSIQPNTLLEKLNQWRTMV